MLCQASLEMRELTLLSHVHVASTNLTDGRPPASPVEKITQVLPLMAMWGRSFRLNASVSKVPSKLSGSESKCERAQLSLHVKGSSVAFEVIQEHL